ncbi:MAG: hypothetical protein ACLP52_14645 [Streptosporangiaceae bacterium]
MTARPARPSLRLTDDGIIDPVAVEIAARGARPVALTPAERSLAAARILGRGGTPYLISARLRVSGTTARTLAAQCQAARVMAGPDLLPHPRQPGGMSVNVGQARVSANGTTWRLRSLIAMGHDASRVARALGVPPHIVRAIIYGRARTITPGLRDLASQLWEAWWCYTPPAVTPAQRRAAAIARGIARRHDWPCPLALDEPDPATGDPGMDAPGYQPDAHWQPAVGLGPAPAFHPATRPQARDIA